MEAMKTAQRIVPVVVTEDWVLHLRRLVLLAWLGAVLAVVVEVWLRTTEPSHWPQVGYFSSSYNLVLGLFVAALLAISSLLVRRRWYEVIPRASVERVRWLVTAIYMWLATHAVLFMHVLGALNSPALLMLPLFLVIAYQLFDDDWAERCAAYVLVVLTAVIVLHGMTPLVSGGQLAPALMGAASPSPLGWVITSVLIAVMLVALALAKAARRRRPARVDAHTGLYTREFLEQRMETEFARAKRHQCSSAMVVMRLDGFEQFAASANYEAARQLLQNLANAVLDTVRLQSDTPARSGADELAVLMPGGTADMAPAIGERLSSVVRRVVDDIDEAGLSVRIAVSTINPEALGEAGFSLADARQPLESDDSLVHYAHVHVSSASQGHGS